MWLFKKKQKEETKKPVEQVNTTKIKVLVFKDMGGNVRSCKAEYTAIEKRDEFGELVSENKDFNHKEDVDFAMESLYRNMQILLDFRRKTKKEQEEELIRRIQKQEKLLFFLEKVVEANAIYNYQDELAKLRDYRVMKNHLRLDTNGAFFYFNKEGLRTYEFDAIDGFLIPRWHGNDTYSSFPDHTRTKKIKVQEDLRFQQEMQGRNFDVKMFRYGTLWFMINIVVFLILGFGIFKVFGILKDNTEPFLKAQELCIENTQKLNTQYTMVFSEALSMHDFLVNQTKEIPKEEATPTVREPITPTGIIKNVVKIP